MCFLLAVAISAHHDQLARWMGVVQGGQSGERLGVVVISLAILARSGRWRSGSVLTQEEGRGSQSRMGVIRVVMIFMVGFRETAMSTSWSALSVNWIYISALSASEGT